MNFSKNQKAYLNLDNFVDYYKSNPDVVHMTSNKDSLFRIKLICDPHPEVIEKLFEAGLHPDTEIAGYPLIFFAINMRRCLFNDDAGVRLFELLVNNCKTDVLSKFNISPLMAASDMPLEYFKILSKKPTLLNRIHISNSGESCSDLTKFISEFEFNEPNRIEKVSILIDLGAVIDNNVNSIQNHILKQVYLNGADLGLFDYLISKGAKIDAVDSKGKNLLWEADDIREISAYHSRCDQLVKHISDSGKSILDFTIERNEPEIALQLISCGADIYHEARPGNKAQGVYQKLLAMDDPQINNILLSINSARNAKSALDEIMGEISTQKIAKP